MCANKPAVIVLDLDPYRESAYALLMQAHVAAGKPAHALAASPNQA